MTITSRGRRRFIRLALSGVMAVPVTRVLGADTPRLDPESERARQFGYTHDAASTSNPARKEGARCANCTHFHGDAGDEWSTCNIFPEHQVNADGWCSAWFSAT